MKQSLSILLISCVLAACSTSTSTPSIRELPPLDQLAIVAGEEDFGMPAAESSGKRTAKGAMVGGGTGAAIGAVLSLGCGPFVAACMGVAVPALGGAGAVGGSFYGVTGLPKDEAERVSARLTKLRRSRNLNQALEESIAGSVPAERLLPESSAGTVMTVAIDRIQLNQDAGNKLALLVRAEILLEHRTSDGVVRLGKKHYTGVSMRLDLEEWLAHDGGVFETEVDRCIADLAAQVACDLAGSADPEAATVAQLGR